MVHDHTVSEEYSDKDIAKAADALLKDELITPDNYYIDLRVMKDFGLGAILDDLHGRPQAPVLYNTLREKLPHYNKRVYDDLRHLTFDRYNDAWFVDYISNPLHAMGILLHAPVTGLVDVLDSHIRINANHSQVIEKYKKVRVDEEHFTKDYDQVTFHINTYPLRLPDEGVAFLASFFIDRYGVNVKVFYQEPETYTAGQFHQFDEWHIYRFDAIAQSDEFFSSLKPLGNMKKTFFSTPLMDPRKEKDFPIGTIPHQKTLIKATYDMFISLDWYDQHVYTPLGVA